MILNWDEFTRRFVLVAVVVLLSSVFFLNTFFNSQITLAEKNEINQYEGYLHETIGNLVRQKQATTQVLAIALSNSMDFRTVLKTRPADLHQRLKKFTDELALHTDYKSIWIQVIDTKGVSIGRSWTKASGDNLSMIRKDIADVLRNPRKINNFSVGKFSLTFKSLAPIFDRNGKLLGILDVISQVDSIDRDLQSGSGVESVVLVDKRYKNQLTKARTGQFIGGYYVANAGVPNSILQLISNYGADKIFHSKNHEVIDGKLVIATPLKNILGEKIAVWVSFKPMQVIDLTNTHQLYKNYTLAMAGTVLFLLLSMLLFYFKKKSDLERHFFYQIFDESSEIIYVTDRHKVVQANRQFFNLFEDVNSVEAFNDQYDCLSSILIEEEGYLTRYVDGIVWYEYLLQDDHKTLLAKLETKDGVRTFKVKVNSINNRIGSDYVSVLLTDITEEVHYKEELEHLIIHDELTGVYNRHYFNEALEEEIKRAHRYQVPFSMISFDVDHFKSVNDDFGHDIGDNVLIRLTKEVARSLRDTDKLCRVGGEEFCILMPETDLEDATVTAERLRKSVQEIPYSDVPRAVTVSLGVTKLNRWDNASTLYKRSDIALYQAKGNGRNRVEVISS
ncbi:sensor domain-containing diguanylate cyclase [Hydrogenovibrio kuenenii]|uniref:sensor domain-containing diguanylate cyclase n=1 Tax=Hydrogenovibrio kuenenii TaxID=63658 RepID=UPI000464F2FA|nr:diguanylate cyclase [Hydrogenovibrio kuenenii]